MVDRVAMTMLPSPPSSPLTLSRLPLELQIHILQACLAVHPQPSHLLTLSAHWHHLAIPLLYRHIHIHSLHQLFRFVDPEAGPHKHCKQHTVQIVINFPGVPGGGAADGDKRRADRVLQASRALISCPLLEHVRFEFFGVRHSELLTSSSFREAEAGLFSLALGALPNLKSFKWLPPSPADQIKGLSIVVVDQAIDPLVNALSDASQLRSLELHHVMFNTADAGLGLFQALSATDKDGNPKLPRFERLILRSATNLSPQGLALLAASPIKTLRSIEVADGFLGSIWGQRVTETSVRTHVEELVQTQTRARNPTLAQWQQEATVDRIMSKVKLVILEGAIGGMSY